MKGLNYNTYILREALFIIVPNIFKDIDAKQTRNKAKEVLKSYRQNQKLANFERAKSTAISSSQYDGMPKSDSYVNKTETKVVKTLEKVRYYEKKCEWIEETINAIGQIDEDEELLAKLLSYRYLRCYNTTKVAILIAKDISKIKPDDFNFDILPESSYRLLHNNALLSVAEVYSSGELLVFDN